MKLDHQLWFLIMFSCFIIVACAVMGLVDSRRRDDSRRISLEMMQREAVIAGHAEWRPGTNGEPTFHWKEAKP